ncbi:hypothetical protein LEN26_016742 [Aphanomyces euteiches]|nr:hypothetical protein LEN26_016742 [Aphanomyces euteiches]KAH9128838.1 hypothetical protein AeMF1_001024 [Aphanomyces euteiches]KAH9195453.1 hypothetical protein AeNC1_002585 [Aphanomyces euteiches]
MSAVEGDALDRELASLKQTISLCNPLFQGHVNDWKSTTHVNEELVQREKTLLSEPPKPLFGPKKKKHVQLDPAVVPRTPLAKDKEITTLLEEINHTKVTKPPQASNNHSEGIAMVEKKDKEKPLPKPIPKAKRMHMDGILHGLPVASNYKLTTTTTEHFEYDSEMKAMNRDKDMSYFRKRDAYSEYVEARARFSKMHSVT